jgi:glycosyltransferase 2 family protein
MEDVAGADRLLPEESATAMSRTGWAWGRLLGGATILTVLVWRVGTGPFLRGVHMVDGWSIAAAGAIAVVTTICCAWRWSLVARGLGVAIPLRPAIAAYYRSQFLNTTLPAGVLGDVDRGLVHGRAANDVGRALRAVAWERSAGQMVQAVLAAIALLALPSPVRSTMLGAGVAVATAALVGGLAVGVLPRDGPSRRPRTIRAVRSDLREGVLAGRTWPGVVWTSIVVVGGHTATFLVAARAAGVHASPARLVPLAFVVLLAMSLPTNIGGWGPREGAAAWAFGAAGLGAAQGVATAVVYGVLSLTAGLPGAVVLVVAWLRRRERRSDVTQAHRQRPVGITVTQGAACG